MKLFTFFLPLILLMCLAAPLSAQKKKQQEQREVVELLALAKQQMGQQDYSGANRTFRQMLALNASLPTEMCYFFAGTLFQLGQYENSLQFLEKYRILAGPGGEFYDESESLKVQLEEKMTIIRQCSSCDSHGYILEKCSECEGKGNLEQACSRCYGRKKIHCSSCNGEGVLIAKDLLGQKKYLTCEDCSGGGIRTCNFCQGEGKTMSNCDFCRGRGQLPSSRICRHEMTQDLSPQ